MSIEKLEDIGFYTLSDNRALHVSPTTNMKRCEMIIIEDCNFKCDYCRGLDHQIFGERLRRQLSIGEIKRNIDHWCEYGPLENIRFSGGEPTLHKHLVEAVAYAKQKGIKRIAVSTNGSNRYKIYEQLIDAGVNDFSISLDAADSKTGDMMTGTNLIGVWNRIVENIQRISSQVYTTVGVVLTPDNVDKFIEIVQFASSLGVQDIRVIPSAQWNQPLPELKKIPKEIMDKHKILKYRVENFIEGKPIRGLVPESPTQCPLVLDDSVIAGEYHYPCVIYMREQGQPIGKVGSNMRDERVEWFINTDTHKDPICKKNCLDVCVSYNTTACNSEFVKSIKCEIKTII